MADDRSPQTALPEVTLAAERLPIDPEKTAILLLGLAVFLAIYFSPPRAVAVDPSGKAFVLSHEGKAAIGLFLMAGIWWVFEVIPIGVTAIAIGVFQAAFFIRPAKDAFHDFMDPSVMFIFGSIVIGLAFTKSGLTKRIAYKMLAVVEERTDMILLGALVVTAALAHLMAHTAVAATMYPILLAIYALYGEGDKPTNFGKALFIGMAYAAGAGSIITFLGAARGPAAAMYEGFTAGMPFLLLIGAAPNAIAYDSRQFSTGEFFRHGIPMSLILLVVLGVALVTLWPLLGMPILVNP